MIKIRMNRRQKKAATTIALMIVSVAALYLFWLAFAVRTGTVVGNKAPGSAFMVVIASWDGLAIALKSLPILLTVGLAYVGAYEIKDWIYYSIIGVTLLGVVSAVYLYGQVELRDTARAFWAHAPAGVPTAIENKEGFVAAAHKGLGTAIAWFVVVLMSELGIKNAGSDDV
jgi:hypothetical protein